MRWVLHADMDAFYASIEQRERPELEGKPVIVGATSPRGVVAAASYEARRFGVRSAMPGFQARALCPHGVFLPTRIGRYKEVSAQVHEVFREFTPEIEPIALDEAFLDITGSLTLFGEPEVLARRLKARVREAVELTVSVGVANTKLVAKIACSLGKPDGLQVVDAGRVQQVLDPLPVARIWGVGPVLQQKLAALGIATVRDLRNYDPVWLERELGVRARELQALARGEDERMVVADRDPKSYGEENTFEADVSDEQKVGQALTAHADAVARRLHRDGTLGSVVILKVKFAQRSDPGPSAIPSRLYPTITRRLSLAEPTDDAAVIRRAAGELWNRTRIVEPIRLVGVTVSGLSRATGQLALFPNHGGRRAVGPTLDAIQQRFGATAIRRGYPAPEKLTPSLRHKKGE